MSDTTQPDVLTTGPDLIWQVPDPLVDADLVTRLGDTTFMFCDSWDTEHLPDLTPVQRAMLVARLRTWADVIERQETQA